jgi:hypothetical protein
LTATYPRGRGEEYAAAVFRFGWEHIDAKLIDQRFLRRGDYNVQTPGSYQVWEYLVEFIDTDGKTKDPRIDATGARKRAEKAREERDKARFEAKLKGLDPPEEKGSDSSSDG